MSRFSRWNKTFDYFARNGLAADAAGIILVVDSPYAFFKTFDAQHVSAIQAVLDGKTAGAPFGDRRFHHHGVTKRRGQQKTRVGVDQRNASDFVFAQELFLGQADVFEKGIGASVEEFKITREINDTQRVAITPFNMYASLMYQHFALHPGAACVQDSIAPRQPKAALSATALASRGEPKKAPEVTSCRDGAQHAGPTQSPRDAGFYYED